MLKMVAMIICMGHQRVNLLVLRASELICAGVGEVGGV